MSYTKEESLAEFNSWSKSYDESLLQWLLFVPAHDYMIGEMGDAGPRPIRLLDIGCGTGTFARRVLKEHRTAEVWGVDFSREMICAGAKHAKQNESRIKFVQADSESLPMADSSFDVVTCSNSFHHYPNQAAAVHEMFRVLRPGGRLLIVDGYRDRLWGRFIFDVCVVAVEGAVHHASARRFRELFYEAGFTGVRQQARLGLAPFLLTVGTAKKPAMTAGHSLPPAVAA
jgi:ubiquinone/menaquinone biosynthesis C-methylase UbiE